jgi:hypothetical protein
MKILVASTPATGHLNPLLAITDKVVLVTQGTVANYNFELLIAPTLAALANESDVLVVATAGGCTVEAIPGAIPSNARLASYLPFEWLLPRVDVLVTNGGYGSVNQAMSFGIPLVTAGMTEDKADVNARVAWSGVGLNLATNEPTPDALRAPSVPCLIDPPTACGRRKWPKNSPASTRDPRFSRSLPRSSLTIGSACGRERWRSVNLGAQLTSGDPIVDHSEGGKVILPSFKQHPKRKTSV